MSKTASASTVCPCGEVEHEGPTACPRAWFTRRRAETDAAVVAYLNDVDALLLPRLGGNGSRRATVAELNAYTAEAEAAGRIIRTDGEPYSTWRLAAEVTA